MNRSERAEIEITDMSKEGEGIGHADGYTLFVKGAVIGDIIEAEVTYAKKDYGFARTVRVISSSKDRVTPPCPVAKECGGCTLQALSYPAQLSFKQKMVENSLRRIGGFDIGVRPIAGMENPFRYRNKSQVPVGRASDGKAADRRASDGKASDRRASAGAVPGGIITGFYRAGSHDIIPFDGCLLSPENDAGILRAVRTFMEQQRIEAYDEKSGTGLVRHVLIRRGFATGEVMVCLILNGKMLPHAEELVKALKVLPGMKSVCLNVNEKRGNVILGEEVLPLYGEPFITDFIGDLRFRISPLSFYQVNPVQTKKLYDTVREFAALTGRETVLDLYCGIGTIGLYLSAQAAKVIGVEIVPAAVEDAKKNAALNGIVNASFSVGAAEECTEALPGADVIVLDPPRRGCDGKLLDAVLAKAPEKIVYVSCNPATLARDLKILCEKDYTLREVRPFDMFPMSTHVECVVLMSRIKDK